MKTFLTTFLLCTGLSLAGTFVHESSVELSASGDFNGDGFADVLLLDKAPASTASATTPAREA